MAPFGLTDDEYEALFGLSGAAHEPLGGEELETLWNKFRRYREAEEAEKYRYTPEQFFALPPEEQRRIESPEHYWRVYEELSTFSGWNRQLENDVMLGVRVCPACNGTRSLPAILRGERTGAFRRRAVSCPCKDLTIRLRYLDHKWGIPERYLFADLQTLAPSSKSKMGIAAQKKEIQLLRDNPANPYFFCGRAGTSKTTYACALLRHQYDQWFPYFVDKCSAAPIRPSFLWMWRINFDVLMNQIQQYAYRDFKSDDAPPPPPDLTPARIVQAAEEAKHSPKTNGRPMLVLEEVDKLKMTNDRLNKLFALIDSLYNIQGQLVMTTNYAFANFTRMMVETNAETGDALMRRINEMCDIREY